MRTNAEFRKVFHGVKVSIAVFFIEDDSCDELTMLARLNANFDKTVNLKAKMFVTLSDPVQGKAKTQIVPKRRCLGLCDSSGVISLVI
jgi:hypothetical protein